MNWPGRKIMLPAVVAAVLGLAVLFFIAGGEQYLVSWRKRVQRGVSLEGIAVEGMRRREVENLVRELAMEIDRPPRNAYLDVETGELVAEVTGCRVDRAATVEKIMNAPAHAMVLLETVQLDPELTVAHYRRINKEIGAYRTWIGGGGGAGHEYHPGHGQHEQLSPFARGGVLL